MNKLLIIENKIINHAFKKAMLKRKKFQLYYLTEGNILYLFILNILSLT